MAEDQDDLVDRVPELIGQPGELGGVQRPVGVAVGVDRVQHDEPADSVVEGVVGGAVSTVGGGEPVATRQPGRGEVLLDDRGAGDQLPVGVGRDAPGARSERQRGQQPADVAVRQSVGQIGRCEAGRRRDDLERPGGDRVQLERLSWEVALDEAVVVAERGVPGHGQPLSPERTPGRVEETGHRREAVAGLRGVVLLPGRRRVGVPVGPVVRRVVVVGHAFPAAQVTGVGSHPCAVEEVDVPPDLVALGVVGVVTGLDGQHQRLSGHRADADRIDLAHHRVGDVCGEHLVRTVGRDEDAGGGQRRRVVETVGVLHAERRLCVDDVHVAELGEGDHVAAPSGAPRSGLDAEVGAHPVPLAGLGDEDGVALAPGPAPAQHPAQGGDLA